MAMTSQEKTQMAKFPSPSGPKYKPWYMANGNTHVSTVDMFDTDRKQNAFIITVYSYLNKKQELIEEIIRVVHLGPITKDIIDEYLKEKGIPIYYREFKRECINRESVELIIKRLKALVS